MLRCHRVVDIFHPQRNFTIILEKSLGSDVGASSHRVMAEEIDPRTALNAQSSIVRSPWLSITDMLIANKCWLCMTPFQRGYKKKVFMVSQLIESLSRQNENVLADSAAGETLAEIESKNFRACYEAFTSELDCDESSLAAELRKHDVPVWTSGLVCYRTAACIQDYSLLVPSVDTSDETTKKVVARLIPSTALPFCPPDCGCDNPWPFLQA